MARRRIRMSDFRGEPAELEMSDGTVYLIRGDLPTEVIAFMADYEQRGGEGVDESVEFDRWLEEGRLLIQQMVREGSPDQAGAVVPSMSPQEMIGTMGAMIGGDSVGQALAAAITDGVGAALNEQRRIQSEEQAPPTKPRRTATKRKSRAKTKTATRRR